MRLFLTITAAFLYDLLILAALSMALSALYTALAGESFHERLVWLSLFQLNWLAMVASYYLISWRRAGQTIGMRAWRIQVVGITQAPLSWKTCWKRLAASILNLLILNLGWLGYLLPARKSLTDHLSHTRIERLPKNS
jgi:uncharacterized RDD family membrane protein YckC